MFQPETFHATETLHDGSTIEIRALRPEDKEAILEEVRHASADTLYHRFFAVKRALSEQEQHFFFDVDFVNHVVLIAVATINGQPRIVGAPASSSPSRARRRSPSRWSTTTSTMGSALC